MRLLVDMSLSPQWVPLLQAAGYDAIHWSAVGPQDAPDQIIMEWARKQARVIFTHDLDFGTMIALTRASGPSVIQLRTQDVAPATAGKLLLSALKTTRESLSRGALVVVDDTKQRARILPLDSPA